MAAPDRSKPTILHILQNAAASLVVVCVVGIWNAAQSTANKLNELTDTMAGVRRDVDRHETILMGLGMSSSERQAEQRRETRRQY